MNTEGRTPPVVKDKSVIKVHTSWSSIGTEVVLVLIKVEDTVTVRKRVGKVNNGFFGSPVPSRLL